MNEKKAKGLRKALNYQPQYNQKENRYKGIRKHPEDPWGTLILVNCPRASYQGLKRGTIPARRLLAGIKE